MDVAWTSVTTQYPNFMVFSIEVPIPSILLCESRSIGIILVMRDYTDRRRYPRFDVAKAVFIEVVRRNSRSESDNEIIRCETVDVSVNGLRLYVTQFIPQGSKLNIAVPMEDLKENLELVGEAVWVKPVETGTGFWVGLELHDSSLENMKKWFKVVHTLSSTPP